LPVYDLEDASAVVENVKILLGREKKIIHWCYY